MWQQNLQIWACSSRRHSRKRSPVCGRGSWRAGGGTSSRACHRNAESGRNSGRWQTPLWRTKKTGKFTHTGPVLQLYGKLFNKHDTITQTSLLIWKAVYVKHYDRSCTLHRTNKRWEGAVKHTWVAFAEHFNGSGHFLLTDALILLPLGGGFEALPGKRAQVEIHEHVPQWLQVVPPGLFCRHTEDNVRSAARGVNPFITSGRILWSYQCPDVCLWRRSGLCQSGSCSRGRGCADACGRHGISWPGRSRWCRPGCPSCPVPSGNCLASHLCGWSSWSGCIQCGWSKGRRRVWEGKSIWIIRYHWDQSCTMCWCVQSTAAPSPLFLFLSGSHHLVSQQQDCLQAELPRAEVEQILQTGPQQLHHHHIVVALGPTPLYRWNTHWGKRRESKSRGKVTLVSFIHVNY